jgi:paraquat-inducible protein A
VQAGEAGEFVESIGMNADLRLPLVFSALFLLVVGNIFPIADMMVGRTVVSVTMIECLTLTNSAGSGPVYLIMLITTIVYPLLEMLSMALRLLRGTPPKAISRYRIVRVFNRMRPCTMIQMYIIGMLVTISQVSLIASVVPGIALASLSMLIVLFAALLVSDSSDLWR